MKYMGSKSRISKYILPIMLEHVIEYDYFYDICCGGGNLIDKVPNTIKRIAVDNNKYLIEALKLIRDNPLSLPKDKTETNEQIYKDMKFSLNKALKGYYGFALSYAGKWFGGWRRDSLGKRDYIAEAYRNALKQSEKLQGCEFICDNYDQLIFPDKSIIYIDPPYQGTTKYKDSFDYAKFWNWVKEIVSSLTKNTGDKKGIEKLFIHKGNQ